MSRHEIASDVDFAPLAPADEHGESTDIVMDRRNPRDTAAMPGSDNATAPLTAQLKQSSRNQVPSAENWTVTDLGHPIKPAQGDIHRVATKNVDGRPCARAGTLGPNGAAFQASPSCTPAAGCLIAVTCGMWLDDP